MKRVVILGSTGSIGENALRVCLSLPDRFEVVGLAANRNRQRLQEQAEAFGVDRIALANDPNTMQVHELAAIDGVDMVVCAIVGMAGLRPVLAALESGHDVALATKEVLVAAGPLVKAACERTGARLLPIDSEHSALFQCLQHRDRLPWCVRVGTDAPAAEDEIRRLILTASGGPFAHRPEVDFETVTPLDALNHPNWSMGSKVTIDSATMMNKGLEIMEAQWLYNLPSEKIDVLVHPESIVHSLVEFTDGNLLAQLSPPDMRFAIQYAMTWPDRPDGGLKPAELTALHFSAPDPARFPCLRLAREASTIGGTMPTVLNAANEVAVAHFLQDAIPFAGIWRAVENVMRKHQPEPVTSLEQIEAVDAWARSANDSD